MSKFLRDTRLMFNRNMTVTIRNPVWVLLGLFQPVLYLILFAPLLENIQMEGYGETEPINIFTPGLLVMTALFSTAFVGFGILEDLKLGIVERFRVTPASRLSLLLGMVLRDVLIFLVQCGVLLLVAALMGLEADPAGLVLLFALLALLSTMIAALSYAMALLFKDESALAASVSTFTVPLLLLSGVMLPMSLAPKWMQTLADFTPLLHTVEATRSLVNGNLDDSVVWLAFAIVAGLAVVTMLWATRIFREATA